MASLSHIGHTAPSPEGGSDPQPISPWLDWRSSHHAGGLPRVEQTVGAATLGCGLERLSPSLEVENGARFMEGHQRCRKMNAMWAALPWESWSHP